MQALKRLDTGLLVRAHNVSASRVKLRRGCVGLADPPYVNFILLRILQLVL
jgi:hypothetical protein